MTQIQAPPSRNPTDNDSLTGLFKVVLTKFLQNNVDDMLPAQVVAFNRAQNVAQVQPLIPVLTTDDVQVTRAQVMSVPVIQLGGGGFMLNFPIKPGDLGFIKANDRDISLFKQTWKQSLPNTQRMHSFSDAVFLPTILTNFSIAGADSANVVLQAVNGAVRLSLGNGNACITDETSYSQSVNCILDLASVTRAFAFPRMSSSQIAAIPSPFPGMAAYDLTTDGLRVYTAAHGWGF